MLQNAKTYMSYENKLMGFYQDLLLMNRSFIKMPEKIHHLAFKLATLCSSGESSSNSRPENDNPKQQNANKMLF